MGFVSICWQQRNTNSSVLSSSRLGVFCIGCMSLSCLCHSSHCFPGHSSSIPPCTRIVTLAPACTVPVLSLICFVALLSAHSSRALFSHFLGPLPNPHPTFPSCVVPTDFSALTSGVCMLCRACWVLAGKAMGKLQITQTAGAFPAKETNASKKWVRSKNGSSTFLCTEDHTAYHATAYSILLT